MRIPTIAAAVVAAAPLLVLGSPQAAACWDTGYGYGATIAAAPVAPRRYGYMGYGYSSPAYYGGYYGYSSPAYYGGIGIRGVGYRDVGWRRGYGYRGIGVGRVGVGRVGVGRVGVGRVGVGRLGVGRIGRGR